MRGKPSDWPITRLSEAEASRAVRDMYGSNNRLSQAEIAVACSDALERKEIGLYNEGWWNNFNGGITKKYY